jgi:hypothetical protein
MSKRAYEVVLYMGSSTPSIDGISVVIDLKPKSSKTVDIISCITDSGLTPADLRARTLFLADEFADRDIVVALYAALIGFSGRRIDFSTGSEPCNVSIFHSAGLQAEDSGKPEQLPDEIIVGGLSENSIDPSNTLSIEDITRIRFARKVVLSPKGEGVAAALTQLIVTSAIRIRNSAEYFPFFATVTDREVDLDDIRRAGSELRRSIRTDSREAIVARGMVTERQKKLQSAAMVSIEETLKYLGSIQNNETGFWRCTRPDRHRNGDANPSMKIEDGKIRCYRCDTELLDSLRLVLDTKDISPDDGANLLLSLEK